MKRIYTFIFLSSTLATLAQKTVKFQAEKTDKIATEKTQTNSTKSNKSYSDFITKDAKTKKGVFTLHQVADKYYFEISNDKFDKDMLLVTTLLSVPEDFGGGYNPAGGNVNDQVVTWERLKDRVLLRKKPYRAVADASKPIAKSVEANYYNPVLYSFPIKTQTTDSSAVVIEVNDFFSKDVAAISGLAADIRKDYKVRGLDESRSFISSIKAFPQNIEVQQNFTFNADESPLNKTTAGLSLAINQSLILLPEKPMKPRLFDPRVGFFTVGHYDYGSEANKADYKTFITRWRLEPKDPEAYKRGELVEPIKPIVYYLDPATPEKLRKYIKEGVELWQKPFEKAGFKNAIIAKDAPTPEQDPEFSPEDVRYSVIRYVASTTRNATGPSVTDPRSGEIIESDIIWYHNHLRSYRNRYLLETGAANPKARTLQTPEEEMGEMMKMVIAHEVGHTLGFPHNMAGSCAFHTEDLRNGDFTQKHGIAASIMDYARFNYVAQPGDKNIRFIRKMGEYDSYATNWGYRWIPEANSPDEEVATLDKWILENQNNPIYKFGNQGSTFDPQNLTENVGDNAISASNYGVKNLKIVAKNLKKWTSDQTNNYQDLKELHEELLACFNRYVGHVVANVGGVYENYKKPNQLGTVYTPVPKNTQMQALEWLKENVFNAPTWIFDTQIYNNLNQEGFVDAIKNTQARPLFSLLSAEKIARILDYENQNDQNLKALEYLKWIRTALFQTTDKSVYRRNLQRAYIDKMSDLLQNKNSQSDLLALVRGELQSLKTVLKSSPKTDTMQQYHVEDLIARITKSLKVE